MRCISGSLDGKTHDIRVGCNLLSRVSKFLPAARTLVVSDSTVAPLHAEAVCASLRSAGIEAELEVIPAGEASKGLERAKSIYDRLAAVKLGRDGLILAVGGGVVSDLAGFVAATWLRGVNWAVCPTSLEGAIDAAIGGKTAINHPAGKNLIGAFHPASQVLIDPECFRTLPQRDLIAGLAESIKHAAIADESFLSWHEARREAILAGESEVMEQLVARNVEIKLAIVTRDFRETSGERASLNFGHTVGHAIEASCGYALRHGECVSLGMAAAAAISHGAGTLHRADAARLTGTLRDFGLPTHDDRLADYDTLKSYLASDKKALAARPRWVLLEGLGRTIIRQDIPETLVREAIEALRAPHRP